MAATGSWANLSRDMLTFIANDAGDGLSLGDYMSLRGVCSAWRSALAPPFPALLRLTDGGRRPPVRLTVFFLPLRRSFRYIYMRPSTALDDCLLFDNLIQSHASIVGSGSGRLAIAVHSQLDVKSWTWRIYLLHPRSGEETELRPPSRAHGQRVRKVVFAPNPQHAGPKDWPTVVALYGRNKVAYIDATRSKEWTTVDIPFEAVVPLEQLVDLAFDAGGENVYCIDISGGVHVLRIPHYRGQKNLQDPAPGPIMASDGLAPPYNVAVLRNPTKHLFFCDGSLYQVWQAERKHRDEIFVLRFHPGGHRPSWDVVKDLGGCSVFVGENSNPTVVRGVRGVRADCVYWINNGLHGAPSRVMVHDLATATCELCCANKGNCWFFDDASVAISNNDEKKLKRKRCST
ncbi:uncharacterized protein [Lolium perenne]|uniref:uncharacterized protein n=1 Tax=Lolium perenne TaxID=4522 RepID=UPI0021F5FE03|nr:uncharacterized protein LOC127329124 [Lolium perenne]